jgi:hypothetical protein
MLGGMSEHQMKAMRKKSNAAPLDVFASADKLSAGAGVAPRHMTGGMSQELLSAMSNLGADVSKVATLSSPPPLDMGFNANTVAVAGVAAGGDTYGDGAGMVQRNPMVTNALAELGVTSVVPATGHRNDSTYPSSTFSNTPTSPRTSMPPGVAPRHMSVMGGSGNEQSNTMLSTTPRKKSLFRPDVVEEAEGEAESDKVAEAEPRKYLL